MNKVPSTVETIETSSLRVSCNNSSDTLGHPRVFLTIKPEMREVICPYCSRRYVLKEQFIMPPLKGAI